MTITNEEFRKSGAGVCGDEEDAIEFSAFLIKKTRPFIFVPMPEDQHEFVVKEDYDGHTIDLIAEFGEISPEEVEEIE